MVNPTIPLSKQPSQEIFSLALLDDTEALDRLAHIAERFGKVQSVLLLSNLPETATSTFLVNFAAHSDAFQAARELHCQLYGFTSVIVSLPRMMTMSPERDSQPVAGPYNPQ